MTLRLILTRHAKSSWQAALASDHERPLNGRGGRSATAIGRWLADHGHMPDLVLSSDAARTRETWALINEQLPGDAPARWLPELYRAGPQEVLDTLRSCQNAQVVMLLGHNPAIGGAADMLLGTTPAASSFQMYPTGATTVIVFGQNDWAGIDWGTGELIDFVVPRDLGVS